MFFVLAADLAAAQGQLRVQAGAFGARAVQLPAGHQRRLVRVVAVHAAAVALQ